MENEYFLTPENFNSSTSEPQNWAQRIKYKAQDIVQSYIDSFTGHDDDILKAKAARLSTFAAMTALGSLGVYIVTKDWAVAGLAGSTSLLCLQISRGYLSQSQILQATQEEEIFQEVSLDDPTDPFTHLILD